MAKQPGAQLFDEELVSTGGATTTVRLVVVGDLQVLPGLDSRVSVLMHGYKMID
jgi:hypothetical protein